MGDLHLMTLAELELLEASYKTAISDITSERVRRMRAASELRWRERLSQFKPGDRIHLEWDDDYTGKQEDTGTFSGIHEGHYPPGEPGVPGPVALYVSDTRKRTYFTYENVSLIY